MKKALYIISIFSLMNVKGVAEESRSYCEKKCSPQACSLNPHQAVICEEACPGYFKECYKAVSEDEKLAVHEGLEKVRRGIAASQVY